MHHQTIQFFSRRNFYKIFFLGFMGILMKLFQQAGNLLYLRSFNINCSSFMDFKSARKYREIPNLPSIILGNTKSPNFSPSTNLNLTNIGIDSWQNKCEKKCNKDRSENKIAFVHLWEADFAKQKFEVQFYFRLWMKTGRRRFEGGEICSARE